MSSLRSNITAPVEAVVDSAASAMPRVQVPVLRPKLPLASQLLPYLQTIDENRIYTNGGPLVMRLHAELSRYLNCHENRIVTAANATAGLSAALLALDVTEECVCLMPSWTFAATPHSAMAAAMKPYFIDVDRRTWALDPSAVRQILPSIPGRIGAIMVVSPFGAPIDVTAWETLQAETGVPVIMDAAAGFDTVCASSLISVVSLHATKLFAAGEGGFIVAPNEEMRGRIRACSNFGFDGTRVAKWRAVNSKLSEYHAALALASFENWPAVRMRHLQIAAWYRQALKRVPAVSLQPDYGNGWACGLTNVLIEGDSAESIARYMAREGIETRLWWGTGCHTQPAFAQCDHTELPETEYLGSRVLGLPHFVDMAKADVSLTVEVLAKALKSRALGRRKAS